LSKKSLEKKIRKFKSFVHFFKSGRCPEGNALWSLTAVSENFVEGAFTRGEFENNPVDYFQRGDALQEKASPYFAYT